MKGLSVVSPDKIPEDQLVFAADTATAVNR